MHKKHETIRTEIEPLGFENREWFSRFRSTLLKKKKNYKLIAPYRHGWSFNHYEILSNIENIEIPSSLSP